MTKLATLIGIVHAGEQLAARVAERQSRIAPLPWMQRALALQARQERGHVRLAAMAMTLTGGQHTATLLGPLDSRLTRDLDNGDFGASIAGLHGVLEHLGDTLLDRLGRHTHPAGAILHRLRLHVRTQEQQHVQLGARCLRALGTGVTPEAAAAYYEIGRAIAMDTASLLDDARIDGGAFWREASGNLSAWQAANTEA